MRQLQLQVQQLIEAKSEHAPSLAFYRHAPADPAPFWTTGQSDPHWIEIQKLLYLYKVLPVTLLMGCV